MHEKVNQPTPQPKLNPESERIVALAEELATRLRSRGCASPEGIESQKPKSFEVIVDGSRFIFFDNRNLGNAIPNEWRCRGEGTA